jgi:hypothetical protein
LNKWRNLDKYPANDIFAPKNYSFDYLFAITMFAQPLAWFEGTGLPKEAFEINNLIKTYKAHNTKIHSGKIFPIGNEPDGKQWTGFQSIGNEKEGYILVFREDNITSKKLVKTWLPLGKKVNFKLVTGAGKSFESQVHEEGGIDFELPEKNSFALFTYSIK